MAKKKSTNREFGDELGVSQGLVGRKRRQGKTDDQIREEAAAKRASMVPPVAPSETYAEAQRRKESALADRYEFENRQRLGELIDVGETERLWVEVAMAFRDSLLSFPEKIAERVAASEEVQLQVRDLIKAEVRAVLTDLPAKIMNVHPADQ